MSDNSEQWFRVKTFYEIEIEPASVTRETDKCVYIKDGWRSGRDTRTYKTSEYGRYIKGWKDAHAFALSLAELRMKNAQKKLQNAEATLETLKGMGPPNQPEDTSNG